MALPRTEMRLQCFIFLTLLFGCISAHQCVHGLGVSPRATNLLREPFPSQSEKSPLFCAFADGLILMLEPHAFESMFSVLLRFAKFAPIRQNALDMLDPQPGQALLDVGSGLGGDAIGLAKRGARVIGLDASARVLERAWKR